MCGIYGFSDVAETDAPQLLQNMGKRIFHRGPDEEGAWNDGKMALGMRRLSIIDLKTGQQPVSNETDDLWVVFNGEIYNHIELRLELQAQGHQFRTDHSDTEVIPHLFEQHGMDFLKKLNGMFAIALWDQKRQELHLCRDHVGIKPLYYAHLGGELIFGSELKSILLHPKVSREPDYRALHHYFSLKNVPAPMSAFKDIRQLGPGEHLVFAKGKIKIHRWFSPSFTGGEQTTEAEAKTEIRRILESSVGLQMRSDVSYGAYLSGGIDSSAVVALMSNISRRRVETFTLAYEEDFKHKAADKHFADLMAKQYQTVHHEHVMNCQELKDGIYDVIESFDEPYSGTISTFFLTKLISKYVKVCLSGDGADELFASYLSPRLAFPLHYYPQYKSRWASLSDSEKALFGSYQSQPELLERLLQRGDEAARRMGQTVFDEAAKSELFSAKMRALSAHTNTETMMREKFQHYSDSDPLNRALQFDFETLLPDQVLPFVDRLSMAHSVEVRPPFLDPRLVTYACSLPGQMKIKNGRVKHILKEALTDLLPSEILDRPKEGFVLPVHQWLKTGLKEMVFDLLTPARLEKHGLLNPSYVAQLLKGHYDGTVDQPNQIWNLMMFQIWWEKYQS